MKIVIISSTAKNINKCQNKTICAVYVINVLKD